MLTEDVKKQLKTVQKQFLCCAPIKSIKFGDLAQESMDWDAQEYLIRKTVIANYVLKYPIKISYQVLFIKHLIDLLSKQNVDVNDIVYDALGRLMALGDPEKCYKHYLFNQRRITLQENPSVVSEGTTGLCTWQASMALSEWCLENKGLFQNKAVLELGSGSGLTGLVISSECYPEKYTFSDCHSSVLTRLCDNIKLNLGIRQTMFKRDKVIMHGFYDCSEIEVVNLPWESVDYETNSIFEANIAVAADVVYDKELFLPLHKALTFLLKYGPCSELILACTERNPDTLNEFLGLLDGLDVKLLKTPSPKHFYWDNTTPIKIFKISY